jgi:hypothetical protein
MLIGSFCSLEHPSTSNNSSGVIRLIISKSTINLTNKIPRYLRALMLFQQHRLLSLYFLFQAMF